MRIRALSTLVLLTAVLLAALVTRGGIDAVTAVARAWMLAPVLVLSASAWAAAPAPGLTPALLARAREHGTAQVIVTLRVPAGASAAAIAAVKQTLLDELASTRHQVVYPLPSLPQLVLEASEDALLALAASPNVLRLDEPRLDRPMR